jgi:hypothetical protein
MKKTLVACAASMLFMTGAANALSLSGEAGKHYTNLGFGQDTGTSGLGLTGNWARSDHNGNVGSLGLKLRPATGAIDCDVRGQGAVSEPEGR